MRGLAWDVGGKAGLRLIPCALSPGGLCWPCSLRGPPGVTTQGPWLPARLVGVGQGRSLESQALSAHPRAACLVRTSCRPGREAWGSSRPPEPAPGLPRPRSPQPCCFQG